MCPDDAALCASKGLGDRINKKKKTFNNLVSDFFIYNCILWAPPYFYHIQCNIVMCEILWFEDKQLIKATLVVSCVMANVGGLLCIHVAILISRTVFLFLLSV